MRNSAQYFRSALTLITSSTVLKPIQARIHLESPEAECCSPLSMEVLVRLMLPFALAAIFLLAGVMLDSNYQRSTPEPTYVQGTVVDFQRPQRKQVYPI